MPVLRNARHERMVAYAKEGIRRCECELHAFMQGQKSSAGWAAATVAYMNVLRRIVSEHA